MLTETERPGNSNGGPWSRPSDDQAQRLCGRVSLANLRSITTRKPGVHKRTHAIQPVLVYWVGSAYLILVMLRNVGIRPGHQELPPRRRRRCLLRCSDAFRVQSGHGRLHGSGDGIRCEGDGNRECHGIPQVLWQEARTARLLMVLRRRNFWITISLLAGLRVRLDRLLIRAPASQGTHQEETKLGRGFNEPRLIPRTCALRPWDCQARRSGYNPRGPRSGRGA